MKYKSKKTKTIPTFTIRARLIIVFLFASIIIFLVNMYMYFNINRNLKVIDSVYVSNVSLNELTQSLAAVQENMYEYLNTKSSDALESYYRSEQDYSNYIYNLNNNISDDNTILMEKNIKNMSLAYLSITNRTVQAKRGRNIQKYKEGYEEAFNIYGYINTYIYNLNNQKFKNNSNQYELLIVSLKYLEAISTIILIVITMINAVLIIVTTSSITNPLSKLAKAANEVSQGNFDIELTPIRYNDEVGVVTNAFNKMITSIKEYILKVKESMEFENRANEKELIMKGHLKDAQLKYLQAQINPHFLFNTLNAGAQLAMMEGAEKTSIFTEKMADFFRYNIKKINEDATLEEEVQLVESYLYIMNVRFSGDIHFIKEMDSTFHQIRVPSMILQPIVENAVNYGIRDIDQEGYVKLRVYSIQDKICISIKDNGKGISRENIQKVMAGEFTEGDLTKNSNGIGLGNVISRLKLYFSTENVIEIISGEGNEGTEVIIYIPISKPQKEEIHVQNHVS